MQLKIEHFCLHAQKRLQFWAILKKLPIIIIIFFFAMPYRLILSLCGHMCFIFFFFSFKVIVKFMNTGQ